MLIAEVVCPTEKEVGGSSDLFQRAFGHCTIPGQGS